MSYVGIGPSNQVFNTPPRRPMDGMGITARVTGNEALDGVLYWGFLLGCGYLAVSLGYRAVTGRKFLPKYRTLAAWELAN